ncbi:MAG: Gldg family protein [Methanothrix sp.]
MGFEIPHFPGINQSFAPDDGFSVGAIKLYVENMGGFVENLNSTDPRDLKDALKDAHILVLLNLKKAFSSSELESIKEYVENGGGLLVFGEHTSMFVPDQDFASGRDFLNDVLNTTGIRINPDTADYIPDHWQYAASALPHIVTRDLGFDLTTSSVGASLNLSGKAKPLIIGRFAFSDKSNQTMPGHLGDRFYERGEVLGDLVIAACDTYGKGKVLVFGDTSYVFNNELPFRYNLIYNSAAWLVSRESDYAAYLCWASAFLLFAIAAYIFAIHTIIGKRRHKITLQFLTCVAFTVAVSLTVSASINDSLIKAPQESEADVAWIDHSHLNQFNLENYRDDGIAGLTLNLFRNGFLPQILEKENGFPDIRKGTVSIIIAPNEHYTPKEATQYKEFVEAGGLLILGAGHKSAGPMDSILRSFGLQIGDLPLGSPPWIEETHATGGRAIVSPENLRRYWHKPKFMEAYPVLADGEYKPITWMRYNGNTYNLIIQKKVGHGNVILIGDSRFLLNENLEHLSLGVGKETREQYQLQWFGNIELLRKILTEQKVGIT